MRSLTVGRGILIRHGESGGGEYRITGGRLGVFEQKLGSEPLNNILGSGSCSALDPHVRSVAQFVQPCVWRCEC